MEWQPIETAPRDGSKFLVTDGRRYSDARWPPKHIIGLWEPDKEGYCGFGYGGGPLDFTPLLWSPLPAIEINPQPTEE